MSQTSSSPENSASVNLQAAKRARPSVLRDWAVRLGGTLLFIAVIVALDLSGTLKLSQVWDALSGADAGLVALSIALYIPFLIVKAFRWRLLSIDMKMPMTWAESLRIYAIGLAAGTFTPGQAGDAVKALYLSKAGYPLARALGGSILDRLFDVAALAVMGLVGVAVYGGRFAGQVPALLAIALACVALVIFFAWSPTREWAFGLVRRRLGRMGSGGDAEKWSLRKETVSLAALLTITSFVISTFRVWLLAGALGVWLGVLEVAGFVGLTTAAALVPITVGGVGTRDVVAALAFGQLGRPGALGVAVSTLILLLNLSQAVAGWAVSLIDKSRLGADA